MQPYSCIFRGALLPLGQLVCHENMLWRFFNHSPDRLFSHPGQGFISLSTLGPLSVFKNSRIVTATEVYTASTASYQRSAEWNTAVTSLFVKDFTL